VESAGAPLDEVGTEQEVHAAREFPTAIARRLVGQLVASPRLAAFARERAPSPVPAAPSDAVASARQHTQQGTAFYNLDRFPEALAEYQAAYLAAPDPALLFNIAQCHRRMGNRAEASDYYRKYLRSAPQAPNRAEVERRIQELEARPRRRG
jgi:tetratricopeptide (TPR) repeat protein